MARRALNGDGRRARLGIVVPSVNTVMEPWAQKVVPPGVGVFAARMFIPPATTPEEVEEIFEGRCRVVHGGATPGGSPSTLVRVRGNRIEVLRPGAVAIAPELVDGS